MKICPVAHAKNAKTPLLVLRGQSDLRCPQSKEGKCICMRKNNVPTKNDSILSIWPWTISSGLQTFVKHLKALQTGLRIQNNSVRSQTAEVDLTSD